MKQSEYDPATGRLVVERFFGNAAEEAANSPAATLSYTYDEFGRVVRQTRVAGAATEVWSWSFDAGGPDAALSVWMTQSHEAVIETLPPKSPLLILSRFDTTAMGGSGSVSPSFTDTVFFVASQPRRSQQRLGHPPNGQRHSVPAR